MVETSTVPIQELVKAQREVRDHYTSNRENLSTPCIPSVYPTPQMSKYCLSVSKNLMKHYLETAQAHWCKAGVGLHTKSAGQCTFE